MESKNKKGYIAIYRKSFGIKESELYAHCKSLYDSAWLYVLASFNYDITNKPWHELPEYCQIELLNTIGSWSKKVALNVGKYYGAEIGKDVIVTSLKLGIKFVKVK